MKSTPPTGLRALLIDIDNTITRVKRETALLTPGRDWSGSLTDVIQLAGVELGKLTSEETSRRIEKIKREVSWWHWSDFIVELGLNPAQFWDYAHAMESRYLEATGPEILPALRQLQQAGLLLYITSNNPNDGILHKLRVAGLATNQGAPLFSQLLGVAGLHAMKWEARYWQKALAHIALDPEQVAVVGDNLHDDYEVPRGVGIGCSFLINRDEDLRQQSTDSLIHVRNFSEIADHLLTPGSRGRR